jgi:MIP family channel proteins
MLAGDYLRRGVAEFIGTFALVFVGAGSVIYGDLVGIALANGVVVAVMVTAVGFGGFFNPAITIGLALTRRIALKLTAFLLLAQLGAAALAALLLRWVLPHAASSNSHLGAPALGNGVSAGKGVTIEAVLTFFLVWIVFATVVDERRGLKQVAGFAIGLMITVDALMGLGLTGAALNPARAFGPELVGDRWANGWVWYVGPIAGAAIAALVYEGLYLASGGPEPEPDAEPADWEAVPHLEPGDGESAAGTAALD